MLPFVGMYTLPSFVVHLKDRWKCEGDSPCPSLLPCLPCSFLHVASSARSYSLPQVLQCGQQRDWETQESPRWEWKYRTRRGCRSSKDAVSCDTSCRHRYLLQLRPSSSSKGWCGRIELHPWWLTSGPNSCFQECHVTGMRFPCSSFRIPSFSAR